MKLPAITSCLRVATLDHAVEPSLWLASMNTLAAWTAQKAGQGAIRGAEIESEVLCGCPADVRLASACLSEALLGMIASPIRDSFVKNHLSPELVYCRWAAPHTDNMFVNELFLSLVVGTGPSPYCIESILPTKRPSRDGRSPPRLGFERQGQELSQGDLFLLDPLVGHYANPVTPHQDSLLSLLQLRLPYRDRRERYRWIQLLAPDRLQPAHTRSDMG